MAQLPAHYKTEKYLLAEGAGAVLVFLLLIIDMTRPYFRFHWFSDSLWLGATLLLTVPALTREKPLMKYPAWLSHPVTPPLLGLYLFLYHFFICVFRLRNISLEWLLHAGAASLFGWAVFQRMKITGYFAEKPDWKNGLRYPYWPLSIGFALLLLAPFFPMTPLNALRSSYGLQFGYNTYSGWGYNNLGYNFYSVKIAIKGYQAYWGHIACILFAILFLFHIARTVLKKELPFTGLFYKAAIPAAVAWWILGAKGYSTLKSSGNILFLAGILLSALAVYLPDKLGEWTKKRSLVS